MHKITYYLGSFILLILSQTAALSQQDHYNAISNYLTVHAEELGLQPSDVIEFVITDNVISGRSGLRHVYLAQSVNGLRVINGTATVVMDQDNEVKHAANRFVSNLPESDNMAGAPALNAEEAIGAAADVLDISYNTFPQLLGQDGQHNFRFGKGDISREQIPVELVYWASPEKELKRAWSLSIYQKDAAHWWHVILDAHSGEILEKYDWVVQCQAAPADTPHGHDHDHRHGPAGNEKAGATSSAPDAYRVYEFPVESPSHGSRTLVTDPADEIASPFGWHDTNGVAGAEYTITRGNNAFAFEDRNDSDLPGFSPDGGSSLNFDFPVDFIEPPQLYQEAAITNAFYAVNRIHDIMYHYGFDEVGGNFQTNNYGNGGQESDELFVNAQDGGGMNNANFASPPDGSSPRMQMYLWGDESDVQFNVNSPASVSGSYVAEPAGFGGPIPGLPLTRDLVLVDDETGPDPHDGCEDIVNSGEVNGKIALIYRGECLFVEKVLNAQDAGAEAVVMINNEPGPPIVMGGSDPAITIPSIMISQGDGNQLVNAINGGATVNATLVDPSASDWRDSDFDNGIIIHEYAHGITNRITGGPSNASCLSNAEQMGEGWSDWYACMLTLDLGGSTPANRPIGSYVLENPISGPGIRNEDYDTSFAVNDYTYGDVNNTSLLSEPHGIGFVWATMLWDLTWAFMKEHGMDDDLLNGTGGDDEVLQLVTDALKLQPCSPGFVDGRDAILLADELNNNGANKCLIWKVFAKRGLGYSADQGSVTSRTDQSEAFDLPPSCQQATSPPTAGFTADTTETCDGRVMFSDLSEDTPHQWYWDFGDGHTDSVQNPDHTYSTPGIYTVQLVVTNTLGADTVTKTNYIHFNPPQPPQVSDEIVCGRDSVTLSAEASGIIRWLDNSFDTIASGPSFQPDTIAGSTTYYVYNEIDKPAQFVGPENNGIGMGAYHNTNFTGTVDFTTEVPLTIRSAHVNVGDPGVKEIFLWNAHSAGGTPIQSVTHDIPFIGPQRVDLNFEIDEPGEYSIGLNNAGLYRNSSGANYPYTLPGTITIVGSSAGQEYYYYLYDLEIDPFSCFSDTVPVTAQKIDAVDFTYADSGLTVDFNDQSGAVGGWQWDFGDGNTSSEQHPTHTYAGEGTYTVTLTVDSCMQSHEISIQSVGIGRNPHGGFEMQLHPNPGNAFTKLTTDIAPRSDLQLSLMSIDGRKIRDVVLRAGQKELTITLDDVAPSVYWLIPDNQSAGKALKLVVIK